MPQDTSLKQATLYRMTTPQSTCPSGLRAKALLEAEGYEVEDRPLTSRAEVDAFKAKHEVTTTPQIFIDGTRIGGFEDLRQALGKFSPAKESPAEDTSTYGPVIALFAVAAAMALIVTSIGVNAFSIGHTLEKFIAISMVLLGLQKLQDVSRFAAMFTSYDLLAMRRASYGIIYPYVETCAGLLMMAGLLTWLSAPAALFISTIGAVSVFKAVYLDKRKLKCACVGGESKVPLGFVSLLENLMMMGMALWMLTQI
jgi:glutaredoxin/uncharacterized membrane protein YphA (DoxX/SURF4 family)